MDKPLLEVDITKKKKKKPICLLGHRKDYFLK